MSDTRKTTKPNVPNLRFPGFSGEWERVTIGQICNIVGGGTPDTNIKEYWNGGIQWFTPSEVGKEKYVSDSIRTISIDGLKNSSAKLLPPYSILLSSRATVGECSINLRECCTNQGFQSAVPKVDITSTEFLYYRLLTHKREFIKKACGSTFLEISAKQISKLNTFIPARSEQEKIADLLSLIDERISIQNKVIEDLKKLKTALEERMLGQCQGKQVRLRDILIERVEKSRINNQYEVLSSTVSGIYSQREYFNKEIASADNTGYKAIHRGDVVLSPQNLWMGNINYNDRFEIGIVSPSYKVFSIDEKFDKGYIAFLLKTRKALWAYSLVSEQGASIVRRNLNYESFLEISFVIPSLKEQQVTAKRLSAFQQKYTMEEAFLRSLLLQKEFMLKSLFI